MLTLETERLILRNWNLNDLDDFFEYAQNPNIGPNAGWEPHKDKETTFNILQSFIEKNEVYAIVYKENNKVIGSIGIHNDVLRNGINSKTIGYVLSEDFWGKGLMTETVYSVINYAFQVMNLDLLSINHYPFNTRSKRVIEKCGFKYEGTLRQAKKIYNGKVYDILCYSITKEEYVNFK